MTLAFDLQKITGWIFSLLFFIIGVLNIVLVHFIPGMVYIVIALFYFPPFRQPVRVLAGFKLPLYAQILFGLLVLWVTIAVGDLMEIFESWYLT